MHACMHGEIRGLVYRSNIQDNVLFLSFFSECFITNYTVQATRRRVSEVFLTEES